jgi:hypothetical protein
MDGCCCTTLTDASAGKKASQDLYQGEQYVTRLTDDNWDEKVTPTSQPTPRSTALNATFHCAHTYLNACCLLLLLWHAAAAAAAAAAAV